MTPSIEDEILDLNDENRIKFYEELALSLTIAVRAIWSDKEYSDKEKIDQIKCINEIMHQVLHKVSQLRANVDAWNEQQSLEHIEHWALETKGVVGYVGAALKSSLKKANKKNLYEVKQKTKMSDSYHVTIKDFKHCSKKELEEQCEDESSIFSEWAEKRGVKKSVKEQRKGRKENKKRFKDTT